ncbi:hypothetical protein MKX03_001118, partial [Papaver bracteatum]
MASGFDGRYPPSHADHRYGSSIGGVLLTNDDVLGDAIPKQQQYSLRRECYSLLKLRVVGEVIKFPGLHPVSLNSDNLQFLRQNDYRATWKADGIRYMMLINSGGCYLIDARFNIRRVRMQFPSLQQEIRGINSTLLDGEMVIDTDPKTHHKQERKYLVFDLMAINGVSVIECPFGERRKMLEEQVIGPRRKLERNPCYKYLEPFGVEVNKFWLLSDINDLVNKFTPELSHGADGIIFQRWNDRYVPFVHQGLLKWNPPEKNSVDFLFEQVHGTGENLYVYEGGRKKCLDGNRVVLRNGEDASEFLSSGSIIECYYYEDNVWCFMRVIKDRDTPNAFRTYQSVMRSIKDNITEEVLLDHIRKTVHSTTTTNANRRSNGGGHGTWRSSDNKSIGQMGCSWRPTPCKTGGTFGHSTAK